MSLNFNSSKSNPSTPIDDNDHYLREVLIFGSMFIQIGEITEKNYREVYARIHTLELLNGAWRIGHKENSKKNFPVYVELKDVKRWIGLHTNVSTTTRNQFMKRVSRSMDDFLKEE